MIQKLHLPQIIKRFFAHLLEIGVTFSISLIPLHLINFPFPDFGILSIYESKLLPNFFLTFSINDRFDISINFISTTLLFILLLI